MIKRKVKIKYKSVEDRYITKKLIDNNIDFIKLKVKDNYINLVLNENDYLNLLKLDYKKVIIYEGFYGSKALFDFFICVKEKLFITLIIVVLLFLSNNLIIKVNIHTNDNDIKRLIYYELIDYKIHDFSLKKSFKNTNRIKKSILTLYKDKIEWIEIVSNGYNYDVYVIKRKKNVTKNESNRCNYVAIKSGTITSITARKGVVNVQENNYVKSGDVLISGSIIYNEELKNEVCASGKVMGEVWYKVNVSYPLIKKEKHFSRNSFFNFSLNLFNNEYFITKNKYNLQRKKYIIGSSFLGLNVYKNSKYNNKTIKLTENEAIKKALDLAKEKLLIKLPKDAKIINQNILKKYTNNDTINIEVLLTSVEELGVVENY